MSHQTTDPNDTNHERPRDGSSLSHLLSLCASLHTPSSSSLTLRQLVPVHQSLCEATTLGMKQSSSKVESVQDAIRTMCSPLTNVEKETALCQFLLLLTQEDAALSEVHQNDQRRRLLAIQYILQVFRRNPLQGLATVALPFLLSPRCQQQQTRLASEDDQQGLEMLEAILDAVFQEHRSEETVDGLEACLEHCLKEELGVDKDDPNDQDHETYSAALSWCWKVQSRVLLRLHQWLLARKFNAQSTMVLDAILNKIVHGMEMESTLSNPTITVCWLRPVTNDLLPYFLEQESTDRNNTQLWKSLWESYLGNPLRLVPTTSILCCILPSFMDKNLPVVVSSTPNNDPTDDPELLRPIQHSLLWKLIHDCVQRGIPALIEPDKNKITNSGRKRAAAGAAGGVNPSTTEGVEDCILRRRGLYMLGLLGPSNQEAEHQIVSTVDNKSNSTSHYLWKKYVMCFEALEMETEPHLVDQVWDTVAELFGACADSFTQPIELLPPPMSWKWMRPLLARIITSYDAPVVRKLAIYRFLKGQVGIDVVHKYKEDEASQELNTAKDSKKSRKKKTRNASANNKHRPAGAPLSILSTSFISDILLPSFDTLAGSVGVMMHIEENRQLVKEDMIPLLSNFLKEYLWATEMSSAMRKELFKALWSEAVVCGLHTKTTVQVFQSLADGLKEEAARIINSSNHTLCQVDNAMLTTVVDSFHLLFGTGSVVLAFRQNLLECLAVMLSYSTSSPVADASPPLEPITILKILGLYSVEEHSTAVPSLNTSEEEAQDWVQRSTTNKALQRWLRNMNPSWIANVAAAVTSAFVRGELLMANIIHISSWDPSTGISEVESSMGRAIVSLCTLVAGSQQGTTLPTASELLWPAIHKGLSYSTIAMMGSTWTNADSVARALILLENGCKTQVISGLGNGDLVVDRKTQEMAPPPANIEAMLLSSITFIMHHIACLLDRNEHSEQKVYQGTRSSGAKQVSTTFAHLISLIQTLHTSYPSSLAIADGVDKILEKSLDVLLMMGESQGENGLDVVKHTSLIYAALSCGAVLKLERSKYMDVCRKLLYLDFENGMQQDSKIDKQASRSMFQFARWGALSCMLPLLNTDAVHSAEETKENEVEVFVEEFLEAAYAAVQKTPADALVALFDCICVAGKQKLSNRPLDGSTAVEPKAIEKMVESMIALMEEHTVSRDVMYMLNETCALIFQPNLLLDEYRRFSSNPEGAYTPIRDAYRRLMHIAGTKRPHISRVVMSKITAGWLSSSEGANAPLGLGAILYRDDLVRAIFHKESLIDISATNQSVDLIETGDDSLYIPTETNEQSIVRGFALVFLSRLASLEKSVDPTVLKELLHYIILKVLHKIGPDNQEVGGIIMTGSPKYCLKIRGWQAMCCLCSFVTTHIAESVCTAVFASLSEPLQGQIRYFIEVFTLQCARVHPRVFGSALLTELSSRNLTLQQVTSLMIISGNLIVGRYQEDFFRQYEEEAPEGGQSNVRLSGVVASVIPWLGSTQGFSRAIAQLLVHKLVPLVTPDVHDRPYISGSDSDNDWFLRSIYKFLDENPEMKRLRKKQSKFFDRYAVEDACTPEGVLSIPVDEGGEANPVHLVEAIKNSLKDVYEDAHGKDAPFWKQVEQQLQEQGEDTNLDNEDEGHVNFQRKIIPVDELNLALEDMRERRLRNVAGRKRRDLIVCATLVDKVPNLGGLARTAEIFAADRLVVPDKSVCKMDNFQSLSVGAGDWIEIEECREENLLQWLRLRKDQGYFVVGLEQTSSSVSLENLDFPNRPTVLLLGKEKEGIPVEFLHAVDQCVEIPQFGIIRSLNVHVSGAIAIWEYTKQQLALER